MWSRLGLDVCKIGITTLMRKMPLCSVGAQPGESGEERKVIETAATIGITCCIDKV